MEYKWGIIGAGRFADNVFAPAINQAENARLVAVMARDRTKAEAFAQKHNANKFFDSVIEYSYVFLMRLFASSR